MLFSADLIEDDADDAVHTRGLKNHSGRRFLAVVLAATAAMSLALFVDTIRLRRLKAVGECHVHQAELLEPLFAQHQNNMEIMTNLAEPPASDTGGAPRESLPAVAVPSACINNYQ